MGKFFSGLAKVASVGASVAVAAAEPAVLINNGVAAVFKHGTKLSNQSIPGLNFITSAAVAFVQNGAETGQWGAEGIMPALMRGGLLMGGSTAVHQGLKVPLKNQTGKSI